jgi:hypothetical protein
MKRLATKAEEKVNILAKLRSRTNRLKKGKLFNHHFAIGF